MSSQRLQPCGRSTLRSFCCTSMRISRSVCFAALPGSFMSRGHRCSLPQTKEKVDTLELDAVLVATGRAPYTAGLNLAAVGAAVDRRGFVPVNDSMQGAPAHPRARSARLALPHPALGVWSP